MKTVEKMTARWARPARALLLLVLFGAGTVLAETSTSDACVVKPTEPLTYPEREDELRLSGRLRARLTFSRPDRAPEVEVLAFAGSKALTDAALDYLRGYRLPCLVPGALQVLDQEVRFNSRDLADDALDESHSKWNCLREPVPFEYEEDKEVVWVKKRPTRTRGNVLLDLKFDGPDVPPTVRVHYNSAPKSFGEAVLDHVKTYRLPCLKPGEAPAYARRNFHYAGSDVGSDYALKDMGLVAFLKSIKDLDKVPAKFDLDSMVCPFKVVWRLYQPAVKNYVEEIGKSVPERRPFLDWLASLSMKLTKDQFEGLMGAETVITVPCGKIEL